MKNNPLSFLFLLFALTFIGSAMADNTSTAKENYKVYCWQCHGMQGGGMGLNVRDMSVQPRDHTSKKAMGGRSDEDIFKVIKDGGLAIDKSVLMPPWKDTLTDDEIHQLVTYLVELCKCR